MFEVHLLFKEAIRAKSGELFNEVTFDKVTTEEGVGGLTVIFEDGSRYLYPWHTLARVRTKGLDLKHKL